jgi:hypothetical protein
MSAGAAVGSLFGERSQVQWKERDPGDDRLSRWCTIMGPAGLTAVFGMGTGVAPPVWSPGIRPVGGQARSAASRSGRPSVAHGSVPARARLKPSPSHSRTPGSQWARSSDRPFQFRSLPGIPCGSGRWSVVQLPCNRTPRAGFLAGRLAFVRTPSGRRRGPLGVVKLLGC